MLVNFYEIEDMDVVELFFGEDPKFAPIMDIIRDHGTLVYESRDMTLLPDGSSDMFVLQTKSRGTAEYIVITRVFQVGDTVNVVVYDRRRAAIDLLSTTLS